MSEKINEAVYSAIPKEEGHILYTHDEDHTGKILIAVDLSSLAADVIAYGCGLAKKLGVKATIIHTIPGITVWKGYEPAAPTNLEHSMEKAAHQKLRSYVELIEHENPGLTACISDIVIVDGNPTETVVRYAEENKYSLTVVGYRGQSALERLLVGSTASSIARYATGSVLIYRPSETNFDPQKITKES